MPLDLVPDQVDRSQTHQDSGAIRFDTVAAAIIAMPPKQRSAARSRATATICRQGKAMPGAARSVFEAIIDRLKWQTGECRPGVALLAADTG